MKPLQLTRQQQQHFAQRMNDELDKMTMSWDNVLKEWYPIAIEALKYSSPLTLRVPQHKFIELFKEEVHGLNMNVVMALCNNMEGRTPHEMGVPSKKWAEILLINNAVATRWTELSKPVNQKVTREFSLMLNNTPVLIGEA